MGKDYEIGSKIKLAGEKEYRNALNAINQQLKLSKSSMTAATSAYAANDKSTAALTTRQKALQQVVQAQTQKVELLRSRYAELKDRLGEDSAETQKMEMAMNRAVSEMNRSTVELQKLNGELQPVGASMGETAAGAKTAAEGIGKVGDEAAKTHPKIEKLKEAGEKAKAGFEVAGKAIKATTQVVASFGAVAAAGAAAAAKLAGDAGTYADNMLTLSQQTGISAETLQKWTYASNFVDTSVETVTGGMRRMIMAMGDAKDGSDTAQQKFAALGVSFANADGSLRGTEDVFWDAIDALGGISNVTERDALAMDLFGKSAQDLEPLIQAGRREFEALGDEAQRLGVVFSDDALSGMGAYDDAMQKLKATAAGMKTALGAAAIPAFQPLVDAAGDAMGEVSAAIQRGADGGEIAEIINRGLERLGGSAEGIGRLVSTMGDTFIAALPSIAGKLAGGLSALFTKAANALPGAVGGLIRNTVPVVLETLGAALPEIAESVIGGAGEVVGELIESLPTILPSLGKAIVNTLAGVLLGGVNAIGSIGDVILAALFGERATVAGATKSLMNSVGDISKEIGVYITGTVDSSGLEGELAAAKQRIDDLYAGIHTVLTDGLPDDAEALRPVLEQTDSIVQGLLGDIDTWEKNAIAALDPKMDGYEKAVQGIRDDAEDARSEVKTLGGEVTTWIGDMAGKNAETVEANMAYLDGLIAQLQALQETYGQTREASTPEANAYRTVSAGGVTEADTQTIGMAFNYVVANKDAAVADAEKEYAETIDDINAKAAEYSAEQQRAMKAEAESKRDTAVTDSIASADAAIQGMFSGIVGAMDDGSRAAISDIAQKRAMSDMLKSLFPEDMDMDTADFDALAAQVQAAYDQIFGEGAYYVNPIFAGARARELIDMLDGEIADELSGADMTMLAASWQSAVENGVFNGTSFENLDFVEFASKIFDGMSGAMNVQDTESIGKNFDSGLARGIRNGASAVISAAEYAAQAAYNAARRALGIASPSRKMIEVGGFFDKGFEKGIRGSMSGVLAAVGEMSDAAVGRVSAPSVGAGSVYGGNGRAAPALAGGVTNVNVSYSGPFTRNDARRFSVVLAQTSTDAINAKGGV